MAERQTDGSAGDADYGVIGVNYAQYRQPDARIAARVLDALGEAVTVLNVGAGAGSYEPSDREVTAIEPSASMRAQRPAYRARALDGTAENLPFGDDSFDAAMGTFTVHQWANLEKGLAEMRRVTRGPIAILTCDPELVRRYWLYEYAPEVLDTEARRYPSIDRIAEALGGAAGGSGHIEVQPVPIPLDCTDGFGEAYYGRPERLLEAGARLANSAWSFVQASVVDRFTESLTRDLANGTWDARHGRLRTQAEFDGSLVLIVARP